MSLEYVYKDGKLKYIRDKCRVLLCCFVYKDCDVFSFKLIKVMFLFHEFILEYFYLILFLFYYMLLLFLHKYGTKK
jgi:hypothetical protein